MGFSTLVSNGGKGQQRKGKRSADGLTMKDGNGIEINRIE